MVMGKTAKRDHWNHSLIGATILNHHIRSGAILNISLGLAGFMYLLHSCTTKNDDSYEKESL
jgi:hypothetical protein